MRWVHCLTLQDMPWPQLPEDITRAFDVAYNNIKAFHEAQRSSDLSVQTMPGVTCRRVARPINNVRALRARMQRCPGPRLSLLGTPAQIAGC